MAEKIATYTAKELALRPSNAGYEAAQQAGRRLGPLAETAARAIRDVADLNAKVVTELGAQQTAFLRFEGLEAKEDRGGGVKYGGGLKDMFQLGAGGNEPNYARLNRLSELQDGTLAIAGAARHIVNAQSPLTHGLSPQQAWEREQNGEGLNDEQLNALGRKQKGMGGYGDYTKTGIQPNAEPSDKDFEKQIQSDWSQDDSAWGSNQFGPPMEARNDKGVATGGNVGGTGGGWDAKGNPQPVYGATNPAEPANWGQAPADQTGFYQQPPDIGDGSTITPGPTPATSGASDVPPPTNSGEWPTVGTAGSADVPTSPADNSQAPPMWGTLQDGM